ncbi:MAG: glycoside hydrolase family 127 protein [Reichenbachiella sp.]|uniref:beta-L-arabinofuranosidase domain-containing protein n=1 Tax=Reichenbachiella sp. TaxID=2184521 RepID=UPI0029662EF5|nr:beta-L-arabinofuranosidase domain-containing protein [Reichenbachiella sp.]MDW3211465.1 glycoside hydrolase family 127 protein [Reichenbachiella sp.]
MRKLLFKCMCFIGLAGFIGCLDQENVAFVTVENPSQRPGTYFFKPSLGSVKPTGWLASYLKTQKNGITGNLDIAGGYPFNLPIWSDTSKVIDDRAQATWWPFEQTGYWIEGMSRVGYLLQDSFLITKSQKFINYPLEHPTSDGFIGPAFLKEAGKTNRWAHVVYFRALMTAYEAAQDVRIIDAIYNHLKYDLNTYPYRHVREMGIIESMLWTYEFTRDESLLHRAKEIFIEGNKINSNRSSSIHQIIDPNRPVNEHGVTFLEFARLGAILYMYTGKTDYLKISLSAYEKVEQQSLLVDGVNSSTELLKGKDPLASHETCDVVEISYGWAKLLQATANPIYADKIEKAAFNAGPGGVTSDFKAMQYFSCPNQVIAGSHTNHNAYMKGNSSMQFAPSAWIKCCPGQVSRSMPLYASQFWFVKNAEIFTGTYGPNIFTTQTVSGEIIEIEESTNYPFEEEIEFNIKTKRDIQFKFNLRIPEWCDAAKIKLNGKPLKIQPRGGEYVELDRVFKNGDQVTLYLPKHVIMSQWANYSGAIEYGSLVFSLGVESDREIDSSSAWSISSEFPALNLAPRSEWNYAFAFRPDNVNDVIQIDVQNGDLEQWTMERAPITIKVPVRKVKNWNLVSTDKVIQEDYWPSHNADTVSTWNKEVIAVEGDFFFTPEIPDREFLIENMSTHVDTVHLVPYGFTDLRMTIFPLSPVD